MVLSDADLEEARKQFLADTGDDGEPDQDQGPAEVQEPEADADEWEGGGKRDLSLGAFGLLAITVVMAFF